MIAREKIWRKAHTSRAVGKKKQRFEKELIKIQCFTLQGNISFYFKRFTTHVIDNFG